MTTTYRCIGKGVTDSNGVAHMTHSTSDGGSTWTDISSNPGYTGTGKGLVDLCASPDAPADISSSSVVSEPYEVLDCSFYDKGTDDTPSPKVINFQNGLNITRGSTGTLIERESTGNGFYIINQTDANEYPYDVNFCIEFDITQITGTAGIAFANGSWRGTPVNSYGTGHYKIECTDTHQNISTPSGSISYEHTYSENTSIRLQFYGVSSLEYSNFEIYSI